MVVRRTWAWLGWLDGRHIPLRELVPFAIVINISPISYMPKNTKSLPGYGKQISTKYIFSIRNAVWNFVFSSFYR